MQTKVVQTEATTSGVLLTSQGTGVALMSTGSDISIVETDQAYYKVKGLFVADKGEALEVRTMRDRSEKLCIQKREKCYAMLK